MSIIKVRDDITHKTPANRPTTGGNEDEETMVGHMPNPESDDDAAQLREDMGLGTEEDDSQTPQPLSIGETINKAEKSRHG